jgi:hypothetical protein
MGNLRQCDIVCACCGHPLTTDPTSAMCFAASTQHYAENFESRSCSKLKNEEFLGDGFFIFFLTVEKTLFMP